MIFSSKLWSWWIYRVVSQAEVETIDEVLLLLVEAP